MTPFVVIWPVRQKGKIPRAIVEEIRSTAFLPSTKAERMHVYFKYMWSHHGVCLVCVSFLSGTGGLKVRVEGGGCVAAASQIASRESGMLFESL